MGSLYCLNDNAARTRTASLRLFTLAGSATHA